MVAAKKIAPRYKGAEEEQDAGPGAAECPICFLVSAELLYLELSRHDNVCSLVAVLPRSKPCHVLQQRHVHW